MSLITNKLLSVGGFFGDAAYVASFLGTENLMVINLSDTSDLSKLDSIATSSLAFDVGLDTVNKIAYVCGSNRISAFDISNPLNISLISFFETTDVADGFSGLDLDLSSNVAYVVGFSSAGYVFSFDISNPSSISQLDYFTSSDFGSNMSLGGPQFCKLDSANNTLYVTNSNTGSFVDDFFAFNVSTPSSITKRYSVSSTSYLQATGIALDLPNSNCYFLSRAEDTIISADISSLSSLTELDRLTDGVKLNGARDLALDLTSSVAYVASQEGVTAIDISNPSAMSIISSLASTGGVPTRTEIDTANGVLYQTFSGEDAIRSFDVSNPAAMVQIDSYLAPGMNGPLGFALDIKT